MALLAATMTLWATAALAAPPPSPGVCQPLASLSFTYPPTTIAGVSARVIYKDLTGPRGMRFDANQNLLVVERNKQISVLTFRNDSTCIGWEKRVVVQNTAIQHGIEIGPGNGANQYLYASSAENVFRWEYNPATAAVVGSPLTIVWNMTNVGAPSGDHITRTLLLEPPVGGVSKSLIVSRGSAGNADDAAANVAAGTAQIRQFPLDGIPAGQGWAWHQGKVLGWGNRNAVGIALSKDGSDIWEVENSSDNLQWRGVDVHQDNPGKPCLLTNPLDAAEELNRIPLKQTDAIPIAQKYYGYPSCFTVWDNSTVPNNPSGPRFAFNTGEQFSVRNPPTSPTDAWCADPKNNVRPALSFQAHSAPLDIVFYDSAKGSSNQGLTKWNGDAFVSFHGSWNRQPPTGYKVVRIPWAVNGSGPAAAPSSKTGYETVVSAPDPSKCPNQCVRPVGVVFDQYGRMMVSSDATGEVFIVQSSGL